MKPYLRYVPSLLTATRVVSALFLFVLPPFHMPWICLYLWCGASDMLDGWLARYLHVESQFGARFDSAADFVWVVAMLYIYVVFLPLQVWMLIWVVLIALIRFGSLGICYKRFGTFDFLHTWANKTTGGLLFFFPQFYLGLGLVGGITLICVCATFSSLEELWLISHMPELDRNVKGAFRWSSGFKKDDIPPVRPS